MTSLRNPKDEAQRPFPGRVDWQNAVSILPLDGTHLIVLGFGLHQTVEEEGGAAEEETDGPADTDGHLSVELRPQHLRAHGEDDSQVPEPGTLIIPSNYPS